MAAETFNDAVAARSVDTLPHKDYVLFRVPRLSRRSVRDLFMDRFVVSMFMNEEGAIPKDTGWLMVSPENIPDTVADVSGYLDLICVTTSDRELLASNWAFYNEFMCHEFASYEDIDVDVFTSAEMIVYEPTESDIAYTLEDRSARKQQRELYNDYDEVKEEV